MKIYAVSIMAFQPRTNERGQEISWVETIPALIPAATMEAAAEAARTHALNRWKESDGWYCHSAAISAVTKEFYKAADDARRAGILNMANDEPDRCFYFEPVLDAEFVS